MSNILQEFMNALDERGVKYTRGAYGDVIFRREDATLVSVRKTLDGEALTISFTRMTVDDAISEIFLAERPSIVAAREAYLEEKRQRHEYLRLKCLGLRAAGSTVEEIANSLDIPESTVLSLIGEAD